MRPISHLVCGFILVFAATLGAYAAAQPVLVKDIVPGNGSFFLRDPLSFKALGSRVIFVEYLPNQDINIIGRSALWISDGTTSGTTKLKEFKTLLGGTMTTCGSQAFFIAVNDEDGPALWRSDGTAAGTRKVKVLGPIEMDWPQEEFVPFGDRLYFSVVIAGQRSLWRSDGTSQGTGRLMNLVTDSLTVTVSNGQVYFVGTLDDGSYGLWQDDPISGVPILVKDLTPGIGDRSTHPFSFASAGGVLYFIRLNRTATRALLWRSDGTTK